MSSVSFQSGGSSGRSGGRSTDTATSSFDLDKELQFDKGDMTKPAFAAQVCFITMVTVVLFSVFVALFYFVFTARVEKGVVTSSVSGAVTSFVSSLKAFLTPAQVATLKDVVDSGTPPDMTDADAAAQRHNTTLIKRTALLLGLTACGVFAALFAAYAGMKSAQGPNGVKGRDYPSLRTVFVVAGLGFAGVVVAEFVFLYAIAARYRPLDNYGVNRSVLDAFLSY